MIFNQVKNKALPTVILLHGGGLSDWSWTKIVNQLSSAYNVITPIIDGHGEDGRETFVSIEDCAAKLIHYIEKDHDGKVFAIGGLSLGAQIVCEVLAQKSHIADYAVIESALVYPMRGTAALTVPVYKLCYGLVKKKWFSRLQAKTLCVPEELFERYYRDSQSISRQSLINITLSNGNYKLNPSIADTPARVLVIVGEKEIGMMKKSADLLHKTIKGSSLYVVPGRKHGELSLAYPEKYVEKLEQFWQMEK